MKLSEIKGERALEVIADLMDPVTEIISDAAFKDAVKNGTKGDAIKYLLKNHQRNVITILALIQGEDPATYEPSLVSLPLLLMDLLNDPDVSSLFGLQSQSTHVASSGSATENTEAKEA